MTKRADVKVVSAVGVSSNSTLSGDSELADRVERAMHQAIRDCLEEGVVDPDTQRDRMLAARDAILAE